MPYRQGYNMTDIKDNSYSHQNDLAHKKSPLSDEFSDETDDQMVYVTTL